MADSSVTRPGTAARLGLRTVALAYLLVLLVLPVGLVFWRTFERGVGPVVDALTQSDAVHAFTVTLEVAVLAVALNALFGVGAAVLLVRYRFPGQRLLDALIDVPIAVSPVVVGLALILVYGRFEPIGSWLESHGLPVIFSLPGMVLATTFVSLPLVVRAVAPVLAELGTEQEQAAHTLGASAWQAFRRITLPGIRWALAYGVVLSLARALGEYGAVAVVSGNLEGQTQTLTLYVQDHFQNFDPVGAYAASAVLALVAVLALLGLTLLRPRKDR